MLGIDRRAASYVWTAAVVLLLLDAVYLIRNTLFVFVVALLFAYLMSPLVDFLDRVLPSKNTRGLALGLAYFIFLGIVGFGVFYVASTVLEQANAFYKTLPDLLQKWQAPGVASMQNDILSKIRGEILHRVKDLSALVPQAGLTFLLVASDLVYVVIVPVLGFIFLKEGDAIKASILSFFDSGPRRRFIDEMMGDVHVLLAQYMRALMLLAAASFVSYGVAFSIMGVPYAMLLAVLGGVLEFIPMIGPLTAAAAAILVAAVSGMSVIPLLIFVVAYRMFTDYLLSPYLMGQGVELHPLVVIFGVFAGHELAGIPGSFLSVPLLALIRVFYVRIQRSYALRSQS